MSSFTFLIKGKFGSARGRAVPDFCPERDYSVLILQRLVKNFYCFAFSEYYEQRRDFSLSDAPFFLVLGVAITNPIKTGIVLRISLSHYFYFHFVGNWDAESTFIWCCHVSYYYFYDNRCAFKGFKGRISRVYKLLISTDLWEGIGKALRKMV